MYEIDFVKIIVVAAFVVGIGMTALSACRGAARLVRWLGRRRPVEAPAREAAREPRRPKDMLYFTLGDVELKYEFDDPEARRWFLIGMREGIEQQIFAMQRRGILPEHWAVEFPPVEIEEHKE